MEATESPKNLGQSLGWFWSGTIITASMFLSSFGLVSLVEHHQRKGLHIASFEHDDMVRDVTRFGGGLLTGFVVTAILYYLPPFKTNATIPAPNPSPATAALPSSTPA